MTYPQLNWKPSHLDLANSGSQSLSWGKDLHKKRMMLSVKSDMKVIFETKQYLMDIKGTQPFLCLQGENFFPTPEQRSHPLASSLPLSMSFIWKRDVAGSFVGLGLFSLFEGKHQDFHVIFVGAVMVSLG